MSDTSRRRSEEFLKLSSQFQLGGLVTESSHPVTAQLSQIAKTSISAALKLLFQVDEDVLRVYERFAASGNAHRLGEATLAALPAPAVALLPEPCAVRESSAE